MRLGAALAFALLATPIAFGVVARAEAADTAGKRTSSPRKPKAAPKPTEPPTPAREPAVRIVYPPSGHAVGPKPGMFVFGSVMDPRRPFRVNGVKVPVHPKGGFLAYLPVVPGSFTFRCELDLPSGTTWAERVLRVQAPEPPLPEGELAAAAGSLVPARDLALRPGDWLRVSLRATPGAEARFLLPGVKGILPMAETHAGFYEGAYLLKEKDSFEQAEIRAVLKAPGKGTLRVDFPGRLSMPRSPPEVHLTKPGSMINLRSAPGRGYVLFPPQGTPFLITGRDGDDVRVELSASFSGWMESKHLLPLPEGTPPPQAVLGDIQSRALDGGALVTLSLSQKVPFQIEEAPDLGGLTLRLFYTSGHTNWIQYDPKDRFLGQILWSQAESSVVEVLLRLEEGRTLWGYDASWHGRFLHLELRKAPRLAEKGSVLKGRLVALDPGHAPASPGAVGPHGLFEERANLQIARELQALLLKEGARAFLTRSPQEAEVSLPERVKRAWSRRAELLVSIHNNAVPDGENPLAQPHGFSVFYYHPHSLNLAKAAYRSYEKYAPIPGEGLRYGDLFVARATQMPSILAESAYLMLPEQEQTLLEDAPRSLYARALLEGLKRFLEGERERQRSLAKEAP